MKSFTTTYSGYSSLPGGLIKTGELIFGENSVQELGNKLIKANVSKVLIIYDKGIYNAGLIEPILTNIKKEAIDIVVFDNIPPEPPYQTVDEMAKLANLQNINGIIGIGGGSVIDAAKILAIYRQNVDQGSLDLFLRPKQDPQRLKFINPVKDYMVMIPTTSGTGAEISNGSIIVNSLGSKDAIECPRPDLIILDPLMAITMPPYITATTGLDALAHCIEMYTSAVRNSFSQMYIGQAIEYIWEALPIAYHHGDDIEARSKMQLAAYLPLQDICGHCHYGHAVSKTIGPVCHKPHGHLTALALPHVIRAISNCDDLKEDFKRIAAKMHLNTTDNTAEVIACAIENLTAELGVKHLEELDVSYDKLNNGAAKTLETKLGSLKNCAAGVPDEKVLKDIIDGMYFK